MPRKYQIIILYILPVLGVAASHLAHANFILSTIFFWGIPSVILTIWARDRALKAAVFAGVAVIITMALDEIFWASHQWAVVSGFSSKFLGLVAWEDIPYWFLFVYFPILYWEHFFERRKEPVWSRRMTRLFGGGIFALLAVSAAWLWLPALLQIPYFYLISTFLFCLLPLFLELYVHPKLGLRFLRVGIYFGYVALLYELTALSLNQWFYPSNQFIGWIVIRGLRFPLEEFVAWIIFGAAAVLSVYEIFDDYQNRK